jgi:SAM-dependent methyltransferase
LFDVKDGTLMKFYDQFYSSEKRWIYNEEKERQILENYIIKPANWLRGDYLLEIGCGQGFHSNLLQSLGYQITGIDMSVSAIKTAQAESSGADFICGDLSTFKPEKNIKASFVEVCRGSIMNLMMNSRKNFATFLNGLNQTESSFFRL